MSKRRAGQLPESLPSDTNVRACTALNTEATGPKVAAGTLELEVTCIHDEYTSDGRNGGTVSS